jgi:hypothetical protein
MIHELQLQGARCAIRASNSQLRRKLRCLRHQEFVVVSRGLIRKDRALIWGVAGNKVRDRIGSASRPGRIAERDDAGGGASGSNLRASDETPRHCGHSR